MYRKRIIVSAGFKVIAIMMIVSISSCASIYRSQKQKINKNYREGIMLYKNGKYQDAQDRFETVLSIDPDYGDAKRYILITREALAKRAKDYYERGMQSKRAGNYDDAINYFLVVLKEDENYKDTKKQLDNVRNSKPVVKRFEASLKKAEIFYKRKQFQRAYEECLSAKKYNPDSGDLSSLMKKTESAMNDKSEPFVDKGKVSMEKNRYTEAKGYFVRALAVNPWDKDAKEFMKKCDKKIFVETGYTEAKEKYQKGELYESFDLFSSVNDREPGYRDTKKYLDMLSDKLGKEIPQHFEKGVTFYDNEQFTEAIAELNKVLRIDPNHQKAREYRERALAKLEIKKSLGAN